MSTNSQRTAHVKRNIFWNLVSSGFSREQIKFALGFTNADYKRYLNYEYETTPATEKQKDYFKALHKWYTRPGKELTLTAVDFICAITSSWPEYNLLRGDSKRHYSEAIDTVQLSTPTEILTPYFRATTYSIFNGSSENKVQDIISALNLTDETVLNGLCIAAAEQPYTWNTDDDTLF